MTRNRTQASESSRRSQRLLTKRNTSTDIQHGQRKRTYGASNNDRNRKSRRKESNSNIGTNKKIWEFFARSVSGFRIWYYYGYFCGSFAESGSVFTVWVVLI